MTKDNRKILNEDEFMEMMENRYGEITTEFVKDGIVREARVINIPLKYFLVDILDEDILSLTINFLFSKSCKLLDNIYFSLHNKFLISLVFKLSFKILFKAFKVTAM